MYLLLRLESGVLSCSIGQGVTHHYNRYFNIISTHKSTAGRLYLELREARAPLIERGAGRSAGRGLLVERRELLEEAQFLRDQRLQLVDAA